jgi:hypothetical protein
MSISALPVYVIGHPEGHTTVRTTSIQNWLDTLEPGHGYTQTLASVNWKAQRTIAAAYQAARAAEDEGTGCEGYGPEPTLTELVQAAAAIRAEYETAQAEAAAARAEYERLRAEHEQALAAVEARQARRQ